MNKKIINIGINNIGEKHFQKPKKLASAKLTEIKAALEQIPDDEVVRLMVGRPSLSIIARELQNEAAINGMTDIIHNELIASLKEDQ